MGGAGAQENDQDSGAISWGDLLGPSLIGVPLMVSYERHWTCQRLRYQVLLNALRLFRRDSDLMRRAAVALAGPLPEHFRLSGALHLRLVDQRGESAVSRANVAVSTEEGDLQQLLGQVWEACPKESAADRARWLGACSRLAGSADAAGAVDLPERFFGTSLGCDKNLKIGTCLRRVFC